MAGRTIIITGASDGIGAAAAGQLAAKGEHVVVVGRSKAKTMAVATAIAVPYHLVDFTDLAQVRALGAELLAAYPRIDVLANNAGGVMGDREVTKDGFEKTFQVNHLAPFLLTHILMPALLAGRAAVIQTSSVGARMYGTIDIDDLDNQKRYTPAKAYSNTKLENIVFTKELDRRFRDQGISAVAFHPGNVATNFASDTTSPMRFVYKTFLKKLLLITPEKGGQALTWLAEGTPGQTWRAGEYYEKNKVARTNPQAADAALGRELWDRSTQMLCL
jgi:NAD(P)-dependent dehydrogenase (short-subunit alcohol dehydrogenase family)